MYSNEALKKKDSQLLEIIKSISPKGSQIKSILTNTRISPKPDDYMLIDECDEAYLKNPGWFEKATAKPTLIGVTATTDACEELLESQLMKSFFNDKVYDSHLKLKLRKGQTQAEYDETTKITFEAMIDMLLKRTMPAIVYCTEAEYKQLDVALKDHVKCIYKNLKN